MWIVIEAFDKYWPVICTDTDGRPLMFDSKEEAQKEADDCQDGRVIEL